MPRKLVIGFGIVAVVGGWWLYQRPHVITVCAWTDPTFQTRDHWKETLEARFREVSRIYSRQTRVAWKVVEAPPNDPERNIVGLDRRRRELLLETGCKADVLVEIATVYEGERRASVNAFSHAVVIVDRPGDTEQRNTLQLAHELAHLFGVTHDDAAGSTIMAATPASETFSPRAAKLIRKLRSYPFATGVAGLNAGWDSRVADALAESMSGVVPKPAVQAHMVLAAALSEDGDDNGAIRHLEAVLKADPSVTAARMELAGALDRRSRQDDAVAVMREGLRIDPKNAAFHGGLGVLLAPHNREEAIDELMEAVHLQPGNAVYYSTLGMILLPEMGQIDAAVTSFQDALRLSPGMLQAERGLAAAQASKQAQDNAALVRAHAAKDPGNGALQYDLGVAEARAGNSAAAVTALERSLQLNPKFAQAHAGLALVHYTRGDFAGAWREVNAQQAQGLTADPKFLAALTRKMPRPPK